MTRKIDLVVVPFHDWRKVQREGARTRDAHLISHLAKHPSVGKILIVNRPTCLPEMVYSRKSARTAGTLISRDLRTNLIRVADNTYALDTFLPDIIAPVRHRKKWFFEAYGRKSVVDAVGRALVRLGIGDYCLLSFNAYAGNLISQLRPRRSLFDAWDNFLRFPGNVSMLDQLGDSYRSYTCAADVWTTNSVENRDFFSGMFDLSDCQVIRNGVDPEHFRQELEIPSDMTNLPRPIVGVGAKVTHLLDTDLLNIVMRGNPGMSFVLVGQVLDRSVMDRIERLPNFHYLGDKHYDEYPAYIRAFDVTMIPYAVGEREHGGDAIKLYEYLAADKPVVSTRISGLIEWPGRIFAAGSPGEFSAAIKKALAAGERHVEIPSDYLWSTKAEQILDLVATAPRRHRGSAHPTTIAFCGTRGLPANYGGFETAIDQISQRFTHHGYDCEVICRRSASTIAEHAEALPHEHEGRRLVYVAGHHSSKLDTFAAAIQTGLHLFKNRRRYHHVFWFNNANLPGILMTVLAGIPMSINTDGLEWRRSKWSWPFKLYYRLASFLIARLGRPLISDSRGIQQYYEGRLFKKTSFIPYGAPEQHEINERRAGEILARYGLEPGRYFLQVTRIEPDNLPLKVAEAFIDSEPARQGYKMVFVGYRQDTPYARRLVAFDGRGGVRVHEAQYDQEVLQALRQHCHCYVHGNSVGGTNPALLEAMAACPRVIAINCVFSREVLGNCGRYFDPNNIRPTLDLALRLPETAEAMQARVRERYDWDEVAVAYMNLAEGRRAAYQPGERMEEMLQVTGKEVPKKHVNDKVQV